MNKRSCLLALSIQSILFSTPLLANSDVEILLNNANSAFTVDQPVGTELMRVNGDGNVGVGTATPASPLHINRGLANGATPKLNEESHLIITNNAGESVLKLESEDSSIVFGVNMAGNTEDLSFVARGGASGTGTDVMTLQEDGNVGIGTNVTSDGTANGGQALKLDVEGAVGASSYCDENGENCQTILQLASGGGSSKFVDGTDPNNAVYTTGNVGINTTTPDSELHVVGSAKVIGNANTDGLIISNATDGIQLKTYAGTEDTARFTSTGTAGDIMSMNLNSGNVGIGTTTPAGDLDVAGEIYSHGQMVITQDINNTATFIRSKDGTNTKGAAINLYNEDDATNPNKMILHASQTYISEKMSIGTPNINDGTANGGQALTLDVAGAVGASHYCDVNGESCVAATDLGSGNTADNLGDHTATQNIDLAANKLVGNGGTEGLTIGATGNVGVGAESLDAKLGVAGSIRVMGDNNIVGITDSTHTSTFYMTYDTAKDGDIVNNFIGAIHMRPGSLSRAQGTTFAADGNVGIGTTTPSDGTTNGGQALKLDVEGAIGASTYCDENGENCQTILQLAGSGGADNLGDHTATQNIDLAANKLVGNGGTDGVAIANNGRVGIGTDTPTAKLHIQDGGTAPAFSGGTDKLAVVSDGNTAIQITGGNTGNSAILFSDPDSRSSGAVDYNHADDSLRFRVNESIKTVIDADGNVGIGTQTTSDGTASGGQALKLDVEGAIGASSYCDENGENCQTILQLAGGSADNLGDHTATQNIDLATNRLVGNGGTEGIAIDSAGNVHIGSGTPAGLRVAQATTNIPGIMLKNSQTSWSIAQFAELGDNSYNGISSAGDIGLIFSGSANVDEGQDLVIAPWSTSTSGLKIAADGNVGIGARSPTAKMHIQAPAWNPGLEPGLGITSNRPSIVLHDSNEPDDDTYSITMESGALEFATTQHTADDWGYDEKTNIMSLLENGNVGIGTASPVFKLDVSGGIRATNGSVTIDRHFAGPSIVMTSSDQTHYPNVADDWEIYPHGDSNQPNSSESFFSISSRNRSTATPTSHFVINSATGNTGIGTSAPGAKLHLSGDGFVESFAQTSSNAGTHGALTRFLTGSSINGGFAVYANGYNEAILTNTENGPLILASSNAERMRLAANGNIGIGTVNPSSKLELEGAGSSNNGLLKASDAADDDEIILDPNFGVTHSRTDAYFNNALVGGRINLRVSNAAERDTVALTAASNGNVGINTSTPNEKLHVVGGVKFEGLAAGATGNYVCRDTSGVITHGGSCAASDERLKKDITAVDDALDKVTQLQGVTYNWKDEKRGTRTELGLIAQAVEEIVPEVVDTANDEIGTKSIRYENLIALLIEGMKEQQAQIEAQQKRIETLEATIK